MVRPDYPFSKRDYIFGSNLVINFILISFVLILYLGYYLSLAIYGITMFIVWCITSIPPLKTDNKKNVRFETKSLKIKHLVFSFLFLTCSFTGCCLVTSQTSFWIFVLLIYLQILFAISAYKFIDDIRDNFVFRISYYAEQLSTCKFILNLWNCAISTSFIADVLIFILYHYGIIYVDLYNIGICFQLFLMPFIKLTGTILFFFLIKGTKKSLHGNKSLKNIEKQLKEGDPSLLELYRINDFYNIEGKIGKYDLLLAKIRKDVSDTTVTRDRECDVLRNNYLKYVKKKYELSLDGNAILYKKVSNHSFINKLTPQTSVHIYADNVDDDSINNYSNILPDNLKLNGDVYLLINQNIKERGTIDINIAPVNKQNIQHFYGLTISSAIYFSFDSLELCFSNDYLILMTMNDFIVIGKSDMMIECTTLYGRVVSSKNHNFEKIVKGMFIYNEINILDIKFPSQKMSLVFTNKEECTKIYEFITNRGMT